jgi:hypothetical protein
VSSGTAYAGGSDTPLADAGDSSREDAYVKPVAQQPGMLDPASRRLFGRRWLW